MRAQETDFGLSNMETYSSFGEKVKATKRKLLRFLIDAKESGKSVVCYGAAAKGVTLIKYCGVRDDLVDHLRKQDIGVSPEYKLPIHLNAPYVQRFGFRPGQCPITEQVARETLILPNRPGLSRADIEYVVDAMEDFYRRR